MHTLSAALKFVFFSFLLSITSSDSSEDGNNCSISIVETIPIGLTYNSTIISKSTFDELINLISNANQSVDIASFYWSLLGTDVMPNPDESSIKGKQLLDTIIDTSKSRGIKVRIAVNDDKNAENSTDLKLLANIADIRKVNFTRLVGAGILHTKFIIVDGKNFYLGSANMDWRSLTQVKELGVVLTDCQLLANDLLKIFEIYWFLGQKNATVPKKWPKELATDYNITNPMNISLNEIEYNGFLSSAPKSFCSLGRTNDINAIISDIKRAKKFIDISVMDYYPMFLYSKNKQFWPTIDDALREAAINRKVKVRLMASQWNHTRKSMPVFLRSLAAFNDSQVFGADIRVKLFVVPSFTPLQKEIPFARVNHNKYMVTDQSAYIGTSNWSADYFVNTGGVGLTLSPKQNETNIRDQLRSIFERDWNSNYAKYL